MEGSKKRGAPDSGVNAKRRKKQKKKTPKPASSGIIRKNSFDALSALKDQEIVLLSEEEEEKPQVQVHDPEGIKHNADFIGFDFSDSEDDDNKPYEYDNFDDQNDYLSNDEGHTYRKSSVPSVNSDFPWLKNHDHSNKMEIVDWLNLEIKDFINYISPSKHEISLRNEVYKKIKYLIITQLWNDCDVQVFGSFATDLYLPGSDIDMVITSKDRKYDTRLYLYQLSAFLRRTELGINVQTIAKAKVPIIKFVEPNSGIHIDISFERTNGLVALKNIRNWLNTTVGLRELVLIIKQFLLVRKLNDVHVGGLGGYSIICLCYSFLKLHPRLLTNSIDPMENLGILLIEFFELYGLNFGYDNVAILFDEETKEPYYIPKRLYPDLMMKNSFAILIRDPDDPSNNISRGSFNIRDIKRSFGGAFQLLTNKCYDLNQASYKERLQDSILGGVIKYKGKLRDFEDARGDVTNEAMVSDTEDYLADLPPLPSKNKKQQIPVVPQKSENDIHYYSEYSSEDESQLQHIIEESQDTKKKQIDDIYGIHSDSDAGNEPAPSLVDTDEEDSKSKVEKTIKRDYWSQKAGL